MRTPIALDTETGLIGQGNLAPELVCASYADLSNLAEGGRLQRHDECKALVASAFTRAAEGRTVIVGQNFAYDAAVFMRRFPDLIPLIFDAYDADGITDTGLNEKLLDLAKGCLGFHFVDGKRRKVYYSLDAISQRRGFGAMDKGDDGWRLRYMDLYDVPLHDWPERAVDYAKTDAVRTLQVYLQQLDDEKALESRNMGNVLYSGFERARAAMALHLMSCHGILIDRGRAERLESALVIERDRLYAILTAEDMLNHTGGIKQKPLMDRVRYFAQREFDALDPTEQLAYDGPEDFIELTETGRVALAAEHLNRYVMDNLGGAASDPLFASYVRYKKIEKCLNTYAVKLKHGYTYPLQPRVNSLLETGRTSMPGKWRGLDVGFSWQTVPRTLPIQVDGVKSMHNCVRPRDGNKIIDADYSVAELRSLGQVCLNLFGASKFAEFFQADPNGDPHAKYAASLMGIPFEEALRLKAEGRLKARQDAKASNFGFPGGMGEHTFMRTERKKYYETEGRQGGLYDKARARHLRDGWIQEWGVKPYFDHIEAATKWGSGQFQSFVSGRWRGGCGFSDGANNFFQSMTADGALRAGWVLAKHMYDPRPLDSGSPWGVLFGSRLLMFIHDQWAIEGPEDFAEDIAKALSEVMEDSMRVFTPDVPAVAEAQVLDRWAK